MSGEPAKAAPFGFEELVGAVAGVHSRMAERAARAVNAQLTIRNWLIGAHICRYQLGGTDRAAYGERVYEALATRLRADGLVRVDARELRRFSKFFRVYPQLVEAVPNELTGPLLGLSEIRETPSPIFSTAPRTLLERLSFSHIVELIRIADPAERAFYERESVQGGWSLRELRRQIASLLYQRSGLSSDKGGLARRTAAGVERASALAVRDPYVFEFLGLSPREVMGESELEDSLLDQVQEFLLELGHGFCFEARQKRILIGDVSYFVDLVFYHRVLKCHVLVELKVDEFKHEHIGQLNTYVSWYERNQMTAGDGPPIGLLLCTQKNQALVEYALAAMSNQLFVSRYELALPSREELAQFLERKMRRTG